MKTKKIVLLLVIASACAGCTGIDVPQPFQSKPYTYISGGDQLGRDTIQNRSLVANHLFPVKGLEENEVLTILGQPQQIQITERNVAEDWYYIYYKDYVAYVPKALYKAKERAAAYSSKSVQKVMERKEGTFLVRFYHDKVIDVVNVES